MLVIGAGASLATTPPIEDCPAPPPAGAVGDFYGPQDVDWDLSRPADPTTFVMSGYSVTSTQVHAPSCLTAADPSVPVRVGLGFAVGTPAPPVEALRTFTVTDARGRTWSPTEAQVYGPTPPGPDGEVRPEYAGLLFDLPVDATSPVLLHLGTLADESVSKVSLDETRATKARP